jgi:hypothetical protein
VPRLDKDLGVCISPLRRGIVVSSTPEEIGP